MPILSKKLFLLFSCCALFLANQVVQAKSVITLTGGVNFINLTQSENLNYLDYQNSWQGSSRSTQAVMGVFMGAELPFSAWDTDLNWQFGLSYYTPSEGYSVSGTTSQAAGASSAAPYTYSLQSTQILFDNKLGMLVGDYYHPYVSAGIGIASNQAYGYTTMPSDTVEHPMSFGNNATNDLSYEVGAGLDIDLKFIPSLEDWRAGLAYRFVYFGEASLGAPVFSNPTSSLMDSSSRLKQSLFVQELLVQITYLF